MNTQAQVPQEWQHSCCCGRLLAGLFGIHTALCSLHPGAFHTQRHISAALPIPSFRKCLAKHSHTTNQGTLGMLLADVPAVFVGNRFAAKIPMKLVHSIAAGIFALMGVLTLFKVETLFA